MTDFLFYGDTGRNASMRHELPIAILDPFLLGIVGGRTHVMASNLERAKIERSLPDAELHDITELGFYDLLKSGMSREEVVLELTSRAAAAMGTREAVADPEMPVAVADRLRSDGIELTPDYRAVAARRRVKSPAELEGIRRAQRAAEAGMAAAADMLRRAEPDGDRLVLDGEALTAEAVRAALRNACTERGAPAPPDVIVASAWQGYGHEPGSGPLPANLPIQIDLWPQDEESGCWADMTRTFVVGEVTEPIRIQEELECEAFNVFEAAGRRTQRTGPGDDPNEGFQFSLGHGVGLEVHEEPGLGQAGLDELVAGDVIAIEPGLWEPEIGGVRFEDLLLITDDGAETLTDYPYALTP
jgi:Xaa-Pro aminopeptidase